MPVAAIGDNLVNVAKVVVGIGFLIFIHELGHFLAAKAMRVRVLKFSLGFGNRLVGFRLGETEYVVSALPLGGYVKMAGENPGEHKTPDPRALSNQKAWRRAIIFAAGVFMNAVGALLLFIVAFRVGVKSTVAKVGQVGGPAFVAGIREGDEIVEIDGRRDLDFEDVQVIVALSAPGRDLQITVRRNGTLQTFAVRPDPNGQEGAGLPTIGITPQASTRIGEVVPGSPAEAAGLAPGDRIVAVRVGSGPIVQVETYGEVLKALRSAKDRLVGLEVEGPGVVRHWQWLTQASIEQYALPLDLGHPSVKVVGRGSPAEAAGLQAGDVILTAGGRPVASVEGLIRAITENGERPLALTVRRGAQVLTLAVTPRIDSPGGDPRIGIMPEVSADDPAEVVHIHEGTAAEEAGIPLGSVVVRVGDIPTDTVGEVRAAVFPLLQPGAGGAPPLPIRLRFRTPDGQYLDRELAAVPVFEYHLGILPEYETRVSEPAGVLAAVRIGWQKTVINLRRVVLTLRRILVTRSVKPGNVVGPVRLPVIAYRYAKSGMGDFLYFLAIVGANLAVINLLPIPILDGGQLVLLAAEKVKGRPLSERAQAYAQYAGLFLILLLVAYVLVQDVQKLL